MMANISKARTLGRFIIPNTTLFPRRNYFELLDKTAESILSIPIAAIVIPIIKPIRVSMGDNPSFVSNQRPPTKPPKMQKETYQPIPKRRMVVFILINLTHLPKFVDFITNKHVISTTQVKSRFGRMISMHMLRIVLRWWRFSIALRLVGFFCTA